MGHNYYNTPISCLMTKGLFYFLTSGIIARLQDSFQAEDVLGVSSDKDLDSIAQSLARQASICICRKIKIKLGFYEAESYTYDEHACIPSLDG